MDVMQYVEHHIKGAMVDGIKNAAQLARRMAALPVIQPKTGPEALVMLAEILEEATK